MDKKPDLRMHGTRGATAMLHKILPGGMPDTPTPGESSNNPKNPFIGTPIEEEEESQIASIEELRSQLEKDEPKTPQFGDIPAASLIEPGKDVGWDKPPPLKKPEHSRNKKQSEPGNIHMLSKVVTPIALGQTDQRYFTEKVVHFIACKSLTEIHKSTDNVTRMVNRVTAAIELGSEYVGRRIERTPLTRLEERTVFKPALDILGEALTMLFRYEEDDKVGYELDEGIYQVLCTELLKLRNEAYDDLIMSGRGIPTLPRWGRDGNINTAWTRNDFEILGATYRAEVENFLAFLAKYHKFNIEKSNKEDDQPLTETAVKPRSFESPIVEKSVPPMTDNNHEHMESAIGWREEQSTLPMETGKHNTKAIRTSDKFEKEAGESISHALRANNLSRSRVWNDVRNSTPSFGHPLENNSGRGMKDMFGRNQGDELSDRDRRESTLSHQDTSNPDRRKPTENGKANDAKRERHAGAPGGPPDGDDDDDDDGNPDRRRGPDRPRRNLNDSRTPGNSNPTGLNNYSEPQFDNRLKVDTIPTWDGDLDTLGRWVIKINRLSERSSTIYRQLGMLVPSRLLGSAEMWYYSQSSETRSRIETNWGTLREAFGAYFMNRAYMDRQKARANRASYRDLENPKETPSEYFIRKLELIDLVYDYTDIEIINEIMSGAPSPWVSIVTPHLYHRLDDFQLAIKFHENNLMNMDRQQFSNSGMYSKESRNPFGRFRNARTNLVGWSKNTVNPPFPKDDSTVSPKGTPEEKGARLCRHCGSGKHWDPDCKYAKKGEKRARVNAASSSPEDLEAQDAYDSLYFEDISDEEQDF